MLKFILGVFIGANLSFIIYAVLSAGKENTNE